MRCPFEDYTGGPDWVKAVAFFIAAMVCVLAAFGSQAGFY